MTAINQPLAETRFLLGQPVKMHARGILIEPCRQHVFAVFQRHAVMMVNEHARFVIVKIFVAARSRACRAGLVPCGGGHLGGGYRGGHVAA